MSTEDLARIRSVAATIRQDMADDVLRFDGQPLTGKLVAEVHANLAAAVSALAGMVDKLTEHVETAIDSAIEFHREYAPHVYADGSTY
jgi:hypothetical protein